MRTQFFFILVVLAVARLASAEVTPLKTSKGCVVEGKYSTAEIVAFLEKVVGDATTCKGNSPQSRDVFLVPMSGQGALILGLTKPLVLTNLHTSPIAIHGPAPSAAGSPSVIFSPGTGFGGSCGITLAGNMFFHDATVLGFVYTGVCLKTSSVPGATAVVYDLVLKSNYIAIGTEKGGSNFIIESSRFESNQYAISNNGDGVRVNDQNRYWWNAQRPIAHSPNSAVAVYPKPTILANAIVPVPGSDTKVLRLKLEHVKKPVSAYSLAVVDKTTFGQAKVLPVPFTNVVLTEGETAAGKTVEFRIPVADLAQVLPTWKGVVANVTFYGEGAAFTTEFSVPKAPQVVTSTDTGCDLSKVAPSDVPAWLASVAQSQTLCLTADKSRKVVFWNVSGTGPKAIPLAAPVVIANVGPPLEIWGSTVNLVTSDEPKVRFTPSSPAFDGVGAFEVQGNVLLANLDVSGFKNGVAAVAVTGNDVQFQNLWARGGSFGIGIVAGAQGVKITKSFFEHNAVAIHLNGEAAVVLSHNRFSGNGTPIDLPTPVAQKYPAPVLKIRPGRFDTNGTLTYRLRASYTYVSGNVPKKAQVWVSDIETDQGTASNATLVPIPAAAVQCQAGEVMTDVECTVKASALPTPAKWKSLVVLWEYPQQRISEMSVVRLLKDGYGCDLTALTTSQAIEKIQSVAGNDALCRAYGDTTQQLYWRPTAAQPVTLALAAPLDVNNIGMPLAIWGSLPGTVQQQDIVRVIPGPGFQGNVGVRIANRVSLANLRVEQFPTAITMSGVDLSVQGAVIGTCTTGVEVLPDASGIDIAHATFSKTPTPVRLQAAQVTVRDNHFFDVESLVVRTPEQQALFPAPVVKAIEAIDPDTPKSKILVTADMPGAMAFQSATLVVSNVVDGNPLNPKNPQNPAFVPVQPESCTMNGGQLVCLIPMLQIAMALPEPKSLAVAVTYADGSGATSEFSAPQVPGFVAEAMQAADDQADGGSGGDDVVDTESDGGETPDVTPEGNEPGPGSSGGEGWLVDKVKDLLESGSSVGDIVAAGVDVDTLLAADVPLPELLGAGYAVDLLIAHGVSVADLLAAGVSEAELAMFGIVPTPLFDPGLDSTPSTAPDAHTTDDEPDTSGDAADGGGCTMIPHRGGSR